MFVLVLVFLYLLVFKHLESPALPLLSLFIFVAVVVVVVVGGGGGGGGVVVVAVGGGGYLLCGFTLLFPRGLEEFLFGDTEIFLLTFFQH